LKEWGRGVGQGSALVLGDASTGGGHFHALWGRGEKTREAAKVEKGLRGVGRSNRREGEKVKI